MNTQISLCEVALLSSPFSKLFYSLPSYMPESLWQVGQRVAVPLAKGVRAGVIISLDSDLLHEQVLLEQSTKKNKDILAQLKPLLWPLEHESVLDKKYLDLLQQLALRYSSPLGKILSQTPIASFLQTQIKIRFSRSNSFETFSLKELLALDFDAKKQLADLWLAKQAQVVGSSDDRLSTEICYLEMNPPWPIKPSAKKQIAVLEFLFDQGAASRRRLLEKFGSQVSQVLNVLQKRNIISIRYGDANEGFEDSQILTEQKEAQHTANFGKPFCLSPEQEQVFTRLSTIVTAKESSTTLLFGITGSGKTALYIELARKVLQQGRSVLLLAPEVALVHKLWSDTQERILGVDKFLFHGSLSLRAKEKVFYALAHSVKPSLLIGTRSALFLPSKNIGLIILDEEHDGSFKQDEGMLYQAKELAWYRAEQEKASLLLGSATPDIKTYYAAEQGFIHLETLENRVHGADLPEVELVQIPKNVQVSELLSPRSKELLLETVQQGEQAIILLNRRGYAPQMYCLDCGTVAQCPHCEISLSYHKSRECLLCHYCGYSLPFPSPCLKCHGVHFLPMGEGTEKMEESLSSFLPSHVESLRLDRDNTRRVGSMEKILKDFALKKASVLVGTQMLSKGHHFPDVTLAIIADADLGLSLPDYRASERTFQLLVQSAGRSGRAQKKGKVIIQTRDVNHYCWRFVQNADYKSFYLHELELRRKRKYPPFIRLALLKMSYPVEYNKGLDLVQKLSDAIKRKGKELQVTVLGPAQAPLAVLHGRKRFHCLLKVQSWQDARAIYTTVVPLIKNSELRLRLDLDPVSLL